MENAKHTPGPWRIGEEGFGLLEIVPAVSTKGARPFLLPIATVHNCYGGNIRANAALIAIAPELLFVLTQIINALPTNLDWLDPVIEQMARDLIKRAKGE